MKDDTEKPDWEKACSFAWPPLRGAECYVDRLSRIPRLYRKSVPGELPDDARALWARIVERGEIDPAQSWLFAGSTGNGKSRCAGALAMVAAARGIWPRWLNAGEIRSAAFADWGAAKELIERNSRARFLVLDDLGRGAPSAQTDEIIFQILDNRAVQEKPAVITTMEGPGTLPSRFKDAQTAAAVVRRIQDYFTTIPLNSKK